MPDKFYLLKLIRNVSQNFLTGGEGDGVWGFGFRHNELWIASLLLT